MSAPADILELVGRFEQQLEAYQSGRYNETQVRREFIDPFFKALGWDIDNVQGFAEAYKDVIHEDQIRVGGATKAPDYCFRVGGTRKFFLEAKKPSVAIKDEPAAAYQLRRYAWSAKLPLSILTDFEEFAVYDGRVKPHKDDSASAARIFYCTFRDYAGQWDWICERFSRDAVLKGAFDKFAESTRAKRGTAEVDAAFLETIEGWRRELAQNLALRNAKLTQRELNFAVQRILDRVIFLRICEDRGIEDYARLRALVNGDRIYPRLAQLFEQADDRYNSGLFHFKKEPNRHEQPDELTLELDIDDKLLRGILRDLYYPECPYEFSVLSADILGQVYEQFLGKVIRLTPGHRAVVDDKPEVKKAGGVYYTPTYIVDYIVRQTVGKLVGEIVDCGGKRSATPLSKASAEKAVAPPASAGSATSLQKAALPARTATAILNRVAKLRILDPACGSGSFLIGAYQWLLDWHLQFYLANDPPRWARETRGRHPVLVHGRKGEWQLSIAERKRILLANIYGVDIDAQAVEVTKLSLLLKVLEGESAQAQIYFALKDRVLPDLGNNIKCGNSLIGPDFYQQSELPLLTDEERYRINVFDWKAEFPVVFGRDASPADLHEAAASPLDYTLPGVPLHGGYRKTRAQRPKTPPPVAPDEEGGFDAVVGNPPYVRVQLFAHHETDYLFRAYTSASSKIDLSVFFLEKSFSLISEHGLVGLITTKQWMSTDYGTGIRSILASGLLKHVLDFGSLPVFANADTYPAILVCQRRKAKEFDYGLVTNRESLNIQSISSLATKPIPFSQLGAEPWNLSGFDLAAIAKSRGLKVVELMEYGHVYIGDLTGMDEAFVLKRDDCDKHSLKSGVLYPYAYRGAEVSRYSETIPRSVVIYPYTESENGNPVLLEEDELRNRAPKLFDRLSSRKGKLRQRMDSRRLYAAQEWYRHLRPGSFNYIRPEKLIFKGIDTRLSVGLLGKDSIFNGANTPAFIPEALGSNSLLFLLGVLNSRLIGFYLVRVCPPKLGGYTRFNATNINATPIRVINFFDKTDKDRHDRMVSLVESMLELHKQLAAARTPQERTALERQIAATDAQIDRLVYDLYGLTEDEIAIVEGRAA